MKKQIARLSPHQNGKVFGVLLAVGTLFFAVPAFLIMQFAGPWVDQSGNTVTFPAFMVFVLPVLYLIFGYITTVIGCAIYNVLARVIGGFEFETRADEA